MKKTHNYYLFLCVGEKSLYKYIREGAAIITLTFTFIQIEIIKIQFFIFQVTVRCRYYLSEHYYPFRHLSERHHASTRYPLKC